MCFFLNLSLYLVLDFLFGWQALDYWLFFIRRYLYQGFLLWNNCLFGCLLYFCWRQLGDFGFILCFNFLFDYWLDNFDLSRPSWPSFDGLRFQPKRLGFLRGLCAILSDFFIMAYLPFSGLQVKIAHILVIFSQLGLRDVESMFELQIFLGVWCEIGEELLKLADLAGVEARAAMIKRIRYWELSPKK